MDVYNKLTFINKNIASIRGNRRADVCNKLTFINRISDQSEGIDERMFITSLHSLTEYHGSIKRESKYWINQRESMSGCL